MAEHTINLVAVTSRNKTNLDAVADKGAIPFLQVRRVVLIGTGHDGNTVTSVMQAGGQGPHGGTIVVTKGKGSDPGSLTVSGAVRARGELEIELKKITKRKITYAD